jgi:hypothetical protein
MGWRGVRLVAAARSAAGSWPSTCWCPTRPEPVTIHPRQIRGKQADYVGYSPRKIAQARQADPACQVIGELPAENAL